MDLLYKDFLYKDLLYKDFGLDKEGSDQIPSTLFQHLKVSSPEPNFRYTTHIKTPFKERLLHKKPLMLNLVVFRGWLLWPWRWFFWF